MNNYEIISLEITDSSKPLKEVITPENTKITLIVGSEINGVSESLLAISNQIIHITMFDTTAA